MEEIRELNPKEEAKRNIEKKIQKRVRIQILIFVVSFLMIIVLIFTMTAAWFTNVAKTSDLVFQTESWGFDAEKITLAEESIRIAPGRSGIIPLTIDNTDAAESVKIGVTISKTSATAEMDEELQKRIFFYVDAPKTNILVEQPDEGEGETESPDIQTETAKRIYLATSAPHNYTYTILPGQQLVMNELYYNDMPLKWEWVYDMLGYYFRGTVNPEAEEDQVSIDEYVRPIEYDYEKAIFDNNQESENYQQLISIGTTTVKEYLNQISAFDGYAGSIDIERAVVIEDKVYYPAEVDDKGYGMWAYLCTQEEIKEAKAYDQELAQSEDANSEEGMNATATIILTAHNVPAKVESVNTEAALKEALEDENTDIVQLSTDILSGTTLDLHEGEKVIDLNGYTLQYTGTETQYDFVTVADGASLTIANGQVDGTTQSTAFAANKTKAFNVIDGNLILSNVKVTEFDVGVCTEDMKAEESGDSNVQITNCDIYAKQIALFVQGNGAATEDVTKVIVYGSKLESEYYIAVSGQGNDDRWGTELVLAETEVYGYYSAVYLPQRSSVTTISKCKLDGNTGIAVKGGTANIYDSEIIGIGDIAVDNAGAAGSGFMDTGDAVYVEAVYNWPVTVCLKGANTIKSDKAYAVELFGQEGKGPGKILIHDGIYEGLKGSANWNEYGNFEIFGGTFQGAVKDTIIRYDVSEE